jgi:predicted translin family RNA/ssDNA-binding protein
MAMTEAQALNEAVLLLTRKMARLAPSTYSEVWSKLPEGARTALDKAERAADRTRDYLGGAEMLDWPVELTDDDDDE